MNSESNEIKNKVKENSFRKIIKKLILYKIKKN